MRGGGGEGVVLQPSTAGRGLVSRSACRTVVFGAALPFAIALATFLRPLCSLGRLCTQLCLSFVRGLLHLPHALIVIECLLMVLVREKVNEGLKEGARDRS